MLARALVAATDRVARDHGDDPDTWRWGDEHLTIAGHRPFADAPLAAIFNLSGPAPGSMYAVNAFSFSPLEDERPFAATHGPVFRAIYDLADLDRSLFVQSTGQSGNVLSAWYRSFEKGWRDGEYVTIPTERAAYESNAAGRLRLGPLASERRGEQEGWRVASTRRLGTTPSTMHPSPAIACAFP